MSNPVPHMMITHELNFCKLKYVCCIPPVSNLRNFACKNLILRRRNKRAKLTFRVECKRITNTYYFIFFYILQVLHLLYRVNCELITLQSTLPRKLQ